MRSLARFLLLVLATTVLLSIATAPIAAFAVSPYGYDQPSARDMNTKTDWRVLPRESPASG